VPAFHDPFAGGGALPLEAQRLGLGKLCFGPQSSGGVLINKAMIEIPPKFLGRPPVESRSAQGKEADRARVAGCRRVG